MNLYLQIVINKDTSLKHHIVFNINQNDLQHVKMEIKLEAMQARNRELDFVIYV